jgi:hypothetical protein
VQLRLSVGFALNSAQSAQANCAEKNGDTNERGIASTEHTEAEDNEQ